MREGVEELPEFLLTRKEVLVGADADFSFGWNYGMRVGEVTPVMAPFGITVYELTESGACDGNEQSQHR